MVPNGYVPIGRFTSRTQSFNLYQRILKRTGMKCDNCGKKQTIATVMSVDIEMMVLATMSFGVWNAFRAKIKLDLDMI